MTLNYRTRRAKKLAVFVSLSFFQRLEFAKNELRYNLKLFCLDEEKKGRYLRTYMQKIIQKNNANWHVKLTNPIQVSCLVSVDD